MKFSFPKLNRIGIFICGIILVIATIFGVIYFQNPAKIEEESDLSDNTTPKFSENPKVILETSAGNITLELFADKAPITVANFMKYVESDFYAGTLFHRVIASFMIQGGGMTAGLQEKTTFDPIKNEATNGLSNDRGTIAMARTNQVDSATSQFFINVVDNSFLNHRNTSPSGFGYCVFGKVIEGMEIVDKIKAVPTKSAGYYDDVPVEDVVIISAKKVQ